mgnify:CR=1 FL=1
MKQYNFEEGDLELLALGLLSENDEQALTTRVQENPDLLLEYEAIQNTLIASALENGVTVPKDSMPTLPLTEEKADDVFTSVFRNNWLRIAAGVILVCSILANFYLMGNGDNEVSESIAVDTKSEFLADLPFETEVFEDLFNYLENDLKDNSCEMSYRATRAFLEQRGLNTPENLEFLADHEGHCDCEVLMNVSEFFPHGEYKHGQIVPKTHRDADIKRAYFQTSEDGPLLAFDAGTGFLSYRL